MVVIFSANHFLLNGPITLVKSGFESFFGYFLKSRWSAWTGQEASLAKDKGTLVPSPIWSVFDLGMWMITPSDVNLTDLRDT